MTLNDRYLDDAYGDIETAKCILLEFIEAEGDSVEAVKVDSIVSQLNRVQKLLERV